MFPGRRTVFGAMLVTLAWEALCAEPTAKRIGTDEARRLAEVALKREYPRRDISLEFVRNPYDPVFIHFEALWPNGR